MALALAMGAAGRAWPDRAVFYRLHVHLFKSTAVALGLHKAQGLGTTYVAWLAMMLLLYPFCRWYLGAWRRHPSSVLRFL